MDTYDLSERPAVEAAPGVHLTQLVAGTRASMLHYHIESGASVPEHRHDHEQLGFVYRGSLTVASGDTRSVVGTGESYALAPEEVHSIANEGEDAAVGIDVFSPPRGDPDW